MPTATNRDISGYIRQKQHSIATVNNAAINRVKTRSVLPYAFYRPVYNVYNQIQEAIKFIIFKFTTQTLVAGATDDGNSTVNGNGTNARFNSLSSILKIGDNIYVVDRAYSLIRKFNTKTLDVTTYIGANNTYNPTIVSSEINYPNCIAHDPVNNIMYIGHNGFFLTVNMNTNAVTRTTLSSISGVSPLVGSIIYKSGVLYILDSQSFFVFKYNLSTSTSSLIAGSPGNSGFVDGIGTAAKFNTGSILPSALTIDSLDNLYVADNNNNAIRKVIPTTGVVTTFKSSTSAIFVLYDSLDNALYYNNSSSIIKLNLSDNTVSDSIATGVDSLLTIAVYDQKTLYVGTSRFTIYKFT